jgi:hypothetical protein
VPVGASGVWLRAAPKLSGRPGRNSVLRERMCPTTLGTKLRAKFCQVGHSKICPFLGPPHATVSCCGLASRSASLRLLRTSDVDDGCEILFSGISRRTQFHCTHCRTENSSCAIQDPSSRLRADCALSASTPIASTSPAYANASIVAHPQFIKMIVDSAEKRT